MTCRLCLSRRRVHDAVGAGWGVAGTFPHGCGGRWAGWVLLSWWQVTYSWGGGVAYRNFYCGICVGYFVGVRDFLSYLSLRLISLGGSGIQMAPVYRPFERRVPGGRSYQRRPAVPAIAPLLSVGWWSAGSDV